ncbi:MAG: HAD family hydrolase [Sphingobacteriales bacterium]|nr:MAG: HAD family hydrolase [Sphingobacteriales bacterium]
MLKAIIWDYDGTLVDTRQKNLNVTRSIISTVTGKPAEAFPVLESVTVYDAANMKVPNWRVLYKEAFGLNDEQTSYAGSLWTEYQLKDNTAISFFNGINEVIHSLSYYGHGIVSQNSKQNITEVLSREGVDQFFKIVIGYEEVSFAFQKPHPEGLLQCIKQLTKLDDECFILYIGDHETDATCAYNANDQLSRKAVYSVGAFYEKEDHSNNWNIKPDFKATHPNDILDIVNLLQ